MNDPRTESEILRARLRGLLANLTHMRTYHVSGLGEMVELLTSEYNWEKIRTALAAWENVPPHESVAAYLRDNPLPDVVGELREKLALALSEQDAARAENATLRTIFPRILEQLKSGACSKDASVEFLQYIPEEVGAVVRRLETELARTRAAADKLAEALRAEAVSDGRYNDSVQPQKTCAALAEWEKEK